MNILFVLVTTLLLFIAAGLDAFAKRRGEERVAPAQRRVGKTTRSVLTEHRSMSLGLMAAGVLSCICLSANAQEIIHARAGEIVATDAAKKTLSLKIADGSTIVFKDVDTPEPAMSFNKTVRSQTVPATDFNKVGAHVVVFYFGYGNLTAVAIKDLGADAPKRSAGSVANFDRHQRMLTLKTETAKPQMLTLSDDTIVDTAEGVIKPADFHPSKGDRVRCFAKGDSQTALLVAPN